MLHTGVQVHKKFESLPPTLGQDATFKVLLPNQPLANYLILLNICQLLIIDCVAFNKHMCLLTSAFICVGIEHLGPSRNVFNIPAPTNKFVKTKAPQQFVVPPVTSHNRAIVALQVTPVLHLCVL